MKASKRIPWKGLTSGLLTGSLLFGGAFLPAQEEAPLPKSFQIVKPVTAVRSALGLTYPEGPTIGIKFQGTDRLPDASAASCA